METKHIRAERLRRSCLPTVSLRPLCSFHAPRSDPHSSAPPFSHLFLFSQEAGTSLKKPFSLWSHRATGSKYSLIPLPDDLPGDAPKPRARFLAVANRIIGGVVIKQHRKSPSSACSGERFGALSGVCASAEPSAAPFGVDPVFNPGTTLFNPFLNVSNFYERSELNSFGVPFGFFPFEECSCFPVVIDVNVNEERAEGILTYLREGFYIDEYTDTVRTVPLQGRSLPSLPNSIPLSLLTHSPPVLPTLPIYPGRC